MRRLTFKRYLERYVRSLSLGNTNSIYKLCGELPANHRLREPLFLYALCTGKVGLLLKAADGCECGSHFAEMAEKYSWDDIEKALEGKDTSLGKNYHKTYRSYVCRRDMPETNSSTKTLMRDKIKRLQDNKGISNYRLYTDLNLNPGNTNAFLKNGDVNKVSLDAARNMLRYMESA